MRLLHGILHLLLQNKPLHLNFLKANLYLLMIQDILTPVVVSRIVRIALSLKAPQLSSHNLTIYTHTPFVYGKL